MDIYIRLKELIKAQNTTQEWVAKKANISFRTFNGWITKRICPKADQAYHIARILNTTVEYLVAGDEGTKYLIDLFQREGILFKPPPRIADIVDIIQALDDEKLNIIRPMIHALGEGKPEQKVSAK